MEDKTREAINQLVLALRSLSKSVDRSYAMGMYTGTGDSMVRSVTKLYEKTKELLPEDFYIQEVLTLEVPEEASDKQKMAQVRLLAAQLLDYLESLGRENRRSRHNHDHERWHWGRGPGTDINIEVDEDGISIDGEPTNWRDLGMELNDQVLRMTKHAIRRAMANIDFDLDAPQPPRPPKPPKPPHGPKRRIIINGEEMTDESGEDEGSEPPAPPVV